MGAALDGTPVGAPATRKRAIQRWRQGARQVSGRSGAAVEIHAGLVLLAIPTRRAGRLVGAQQLAPHARLDRLAFRYWCCGLIRSDWFARPTTSCVRVQIARSLIRARA